MKPSRAGLKMGCMSVMNNLLAALRLLAVVLLLPVAAMAADDASEAVAESRSVEDELRFDILEFEVDGNTVLPALAIEKALYPFLGELKTAEDVDDARAALESAYQQAGYLTVIVNVPEQRVDTGLVKLEVVEGTVDRFRVSGTTYYAAGYIRSRIPAVQEGEVPYFPDVQKQIAAFNQAPGRSVTPVLKAGRTPGTVEVEAKVSDQTPLHAAVELNNRQSLNTDPLRLQASVRYDNLWGKDHSISFLYLTSPTDTTQVQVMSANYLFRLPESGTIIAFYGVRSRSNIAAVGDVTVLGDANIFGARAIVPLRTVDSWSHAAVLGVDYKDFLENLNLQGANSSIRTPISYVPFTAGYQFTRQSKRSITRGTISANFAMRGDLLGNQDEEFENRRYNARASYFFVRGELSRQQALARGFTGFVKVGGQTAAQALVNTEQFFVGGVDTVRGYYEAEAVGENAIYGTVELRSPSLFPSVEGSARELIALAFVDAGQVWTKDPLPQQRTNTDLIGTGLGLRFKADKNLAAAVELGVPLRDAQKTRSGDPRLNFRVAYDF